MSSVMCWVPARLLLTREVVYISCSSHFDGVPFPTPHNFSSLFVFWLWERKGSFSSVSSAFLLWALAASSIICSQLLILERVVVGWLLLLASQWLVQRCLCNECRHRTWFGCHALLWRGGRIVSLKCNETWKWIRLSFGFSFNPFVP